MMFLMFLIFLMICGAHLKIIICEARLEIVVSKYVSNMFDYIYWGKLIIILYCTTNNHGH